MKIVVQFMTLEGEFALMRTETFADYDAAMAAVQVHAATAGFTFVNLVHDPEDDTIRFAARTPGGRNGRNIAFADEHDEHDEHDDSAEVS